MPKKLITAALLAAPLPVLAGTGATTTEVAPVLVTATRTAISADAALASVTIIDRADIERLQPVSLADLLEGLPGITLAQSGGLGQQTSLFMRGTNSSHTLLLIDGIRVGTVSAGLPAFEQLPVDQIERIEIVRGPRSSLYGADAIGGVIQIFTRHGGTGGTTPSLRLGAGSRGYADGQAGLSGGTGTGWYNLSVGGQRTDGINACRVGAAEAFAGCFADEPDPDGMHALHALADAGWRFGADDELTGTFLRDVTHIAFDGAPYGNQARNVQQVAGMRLGLQLAPAWLATFSAGQSIDRSDVYNDGVFLRYSDSHRDQASWQNELAIGRDQQLTLGLDWQRERLGSDTGYLASRRTDTGLFGQYQAQLGRQSWQFSLRRDHNQQFGDHTTGALAWGYAFGGGMRLSASWGSAFHAPTFNDVYYPYGLGNPDLAPETSHSAELGLTQERADWHWAVHAYRTDIGQLIALDDAYFPRNISRARIRGVEGQLGTSLAGWRLEGYLTLQQPENRSGSTRGHLLPRRPERTARIELDRDFGRFSAGADVLAEGYRYDDLANTRRLGGYAIADLRAAWRFARAWQVEARVANLFDRRYETVYYFNQPGRSLYLTLRYVPRG